MSFHDEGPAASSSSTSDARDPDIMTPQAVSNHDAGHSNGGDDYTSAMHKLQVTKGRPAKRRAGPSCCDEPSASSSSDASDPADMDILSQRSMSDHDDDHDPGGDHYAPTMHTSRAERAARREALQARQTAPKGPSPSIISSKVRRGRGPKRKQPASGSPGPSAEAWSHPILDMAQQVGNPRRKRHRKQNSRVSGKGGTGASEQGTGSEPSNQERAWPASEAAPASPSVEAAIAIGVSSPMDMMPAIPDKGHERMMAMATSMKKAEPETDVRWPSPARSDSEYEEGPPRPGQKRHPKVRLKARAVRRLNRKRDKEEAAELPSIAAANVTQEVESKEHQKATAPARIKKGPVLNKSNKGRFGSWHQHNISLVTGPDGKIIRIEANLPEQDDAMDAEEAGEQKRHGRASRIHKLPTTAIEPVPKDYLFRENWRPWLTKQVTFVGVRISDLKAEGRGSYLCKFDFKGTSWPEWRFGEYDDKILAARAYDRAAIAIYGPQRALTSFVIIGYPEEELAQRKGLDLLRFLGKLQSEAKQPLQLDSSTSCGQCLACLQPALLVPCLVKKTTGAAGRRYSKPPPFIHVPPEYERLEGATEQPVEIARKQAVIPLRERRQHATARAHAMEAAKKEVEGLMRVQAQKRHRKKLEPAQFSRNKSAADLRIYDIECHPFVPRWSAEPEVEAWAKYSPREHCQWALEELHSIFRCLARGRPVEISPLEENPDAGACSRCSSMHHRTTSVLECPAYALCTTDHSLPAFTQAKVKAVPRQTAAVRGALRQFPGWSHLAHTLPSSPFEELFAGAYMRLSTEQQVPGPAKPDSASTAPPGSMQPGSLTTAAASQAVSQPRANSADSKPEACGFQPWQSRPQNHATTNAMAGAADQQHKTAQRGAGRPPSRISPRHGPVELRPWDPGQAQHLLARQQGFPDSTAVQELEADGASARADEPPQQRSSGDGSGGDDDDNESALRKGRLRPAFARVLQALQAYAGILADDKGIKASRRLSAADLLACGLLVERKLRQQQAAELQDPQALRRPATAHEAAQANVNGLVSLHQAELLPSTS